MAGAWRRSGEEQPAFIWISCGSAESSGLLPIAWRQKLVIIRLISMEAPAAFFPQDPTEAMETRSSQPAPGLEGRVLDQSDSGFSGMERQGMKPKKAQFCFVLFFFL